MSNIQVAPLRAVISILDPRVRSTDEIIVHSDYSAVSSTPEVELE